MKYAITILLLAFAWSVSAAEYLTPMTTTNGVVVKPSNFWAANSNELNAVVLHPNEGGDTIYNYTTNFYTASNSFVGILLNPISNGTNFLLDFDALNSYGATAIYQSILATNDVTFSSISNVSQWDLVSLNIVASGGDRLISVPTNTFHPPSFYTNGWTLSGSLYSLTLASGNELRMTCQSNITFSTTWQAYGQ